MAIEALNAPLILIERDVLEKVLLLHSHDLPMAGEVVESIRRAITAADKALSLTSTNHESPTAKG